MRRDSDAGVVRWRSDTLDMNRVRLGCFDWDPFAALLPQNVGMIEQDVPAMLRQVFDAIAEKLDQPVRINVPCILRPLPARRGQAAP